MSLSIQACSFEFSSRSTSQTVLVIGVDQLGASAIRCSKDSKNQNPDSGFEVLCREFSRWTHAYTPSTLAVPALTSMMTAEYPITHGSRHNGNHFLAANFETVAEAAAAKGWETLFISGGAPVFRKSGLSQGFEVFDDSIKPGMNGLFRPFQQSLDIYLGQLKEIGRQSSLGWIYAPDLLFTKNQTRNNLGEPRNLSYESQLEQFDDDLEKLFKNLKSQKRWDSTTIIIAGLNSPYSGHHHNISPLENLYSESTQVALFIKWPLQTEFVSSDESVSLADVGASLFDLISGPEKQSKFSSSADFPVLPLHPGSALNPLLPQRWIPLESAWASWQKDSEIKYAFRRGAFLCLQGTDFRCYNSLTDREELLPLAKSEITKLNFNSSIQELISPNISVPKVSHATLQLNETACYQMMKMPRLQAADLKKCDDPAVLDLAQWILDDHDPQVETAQKEISKRKFVKALTYHLLDLKIDETNQQLGMIWDVSLEKIHRRKILEEILALPEAAKYRAQAQRSLSEL